MVVTGDETARPGQSVRGLEPHAHDRYAIGVERLLLTIDKKEIHVDNPGVFVIPMSKDLFPDVFDLVNDLRKCGIPCDMDLTGRSFKGQMRRADREKRKFVILLGEDEIKAEKLLLKNMDSGEQDLLDFEQAVERLRGAFGGQVKSKK